MADNGMSLLYTIGGYVAVFGAGYGIYYLSTRPDAKKRAAAAKAKAVLPEARKEDRKKKQRMEAFAQEVQNASKAAPNPLAEAKEPQAAVGSGRDTMDDSAANREFAKQLAKAQEGTKFAAKSDSKQREKSVKQSKANHIDGTKSAKASTSAPAAPVESNVEESVNEANEEPAHAPAEAGRVDDMLEPKAAAPSVLRLTGSKPTEEKKKASKPVEKTETKKQRQNRKKAEAAKAAREEAETERKALEEKQRRQARIAEGRPAKDGSQYTNGASAAWKQGAPNGATKTNGELHQPLDTFDSSKPSSAPAVKPNHNASVAPAVTESQAQHDEDEWSTVKTKSSKKKAASIGSGDEEVVAAPKTAPAVAPVSKPVAAKSKINGSGTQKAFGGSFSALTTNNEDNDDEEEEEEWDV